MTALDRELEREQARLEELAKDARELAEGTGTDLVAVTKSPEESRRQMARMKVAAEKRTKALRKQQDRVKAIVERQAAIAERRMSQALEALRPMQEMVKRLEEGLWTVNLYLGTKHEILTLRDGEPAPADTTITVRQMVLSMDEECAIAAEDGGLDAQSIEQFDRWLLKRKANLDQVLPEPKGVVALVPRMRDHRKTGSAWMDMRVEEADEQTYLLIRNGERLFRILPDFRVGENLLPTADEFTSIFEYRDGYGAKAKTKVLKPGTPKWDDAYKRMEERERHFMRVALILQGLADLTTVFHPLTAAGVSFLDRSHYTDERVRFVNDAERALGTGREPFGQWRERLMGELKVGMRIVGAFHGRYDGTGFGGEAYKGSTWSPAGHKRLSPSSADWPDSEVLHTLEDRRPDGGFVFRYAREVYDERTWQRRESKTRASCVVYAKDDWIIPFDLVTVEECETYLKARTERQAYKKMFPILKRVVKLKREEEKEERPFRKMLAGVLARENDVPVAEAEAELDALVKWWKTKVRNHRPLVGDEESQAKAVRMIVGEHRRRIEDRHRPINEKVVAGLRDAYRDAIAIVRPRRGGYLVLVPAESKNVYVHEYELSARGVLKGKKEWQLVRGREQRWTIAWATPRWGRWDLSASHHEHLTGPEKERLLAAVKAQHQQRKPDRYEGPLIAVTYTEASGKFHAWMHTGDEDFDESLGSRLREPDAHGREHEWRRRSDGTPELHESFFGGSLRVGKYRSPFDEEEGPVQWGWHEKKRELLWHAPVRERALEDAIAEYGPARERRDDLEEQAGQWYSSIREQWFAIEWKRLYDEFLHEFVDPELWEGHRKGLKEPRWDGWRVDLLWDVCARAIEQGYDPEGKTVAQVMDELKVLRDPKKEELPEGAADLVFGAEPITGPWVSPDEDDEEEEDDGRAECVECGELRDDPDEFHDGLRCVYCADADEEEDEEDDEPIDAEYEEEEEEVEA